MGTLNERLADAVACGSMSADSGFDVQRSPRTALRNTYIDLIHANPIHALPIIRKSLMASPAIGADCFRDDATLATSL